MTRRSLLWGMVTSASTAQQDGKGQVDQMARQTVSVLCLCCGSPTLQERDNHSQRQSVLKIRASPLAPSTCLRDLKVDAVMQVQAHPSRQHTPSRAPTLPRTHVAGTHQVATRSQHSQRSAVGAARPLFCCKTPTAADPLYSHFMACSYATVRQRERRRGTSVGSPCFCPGREVFKSVRRLVLFVPRLAATSLLCTRR